MCAPGQPNLALDWREHVGRHTTCHSVSILPLLFAGHGELPGAHERGDQGKIV